MWLLPCGLITLWRSWSRVWQELWLGYSRTPQVAPAELEEFPGLSVASSNEVRGKYVCSPKWQ